MSHKPGEYVIENLMKSFIKISFNKTELFVKNEKVLSIRKGMRYNDDCEFQNLLLALNACAENSLPSLLKALLDWHNNNYSHGLFTKPANVRKCDKIKLPDVCATSDITNTDMSASTNSYFASEPMATSNQMSDSTTTDNIHITEKRDIGVDYIFCQSIISVLKQLSLHPGHDEMLNVVLSMAFQHFKYRDDLMANPNNLLINEIADLYAEVVGVLTQSRFNLVRMKFTSELKSLRNKEANSSGFQSIISLLMGMKFFRVKMYPIEDFVDCFNFLTELANYFIEVDDKKIKHALAGLFVEVLLPVAAVVKNEVNIPVLKNFVEFLYNTCSDMCSKKKHFIALSPLVTCLLSIGQKQFFLVNWPVFMLACLSQLKNRDPNIARVALESLFRLLWVYIVRIKGEKHTDTQSKLHSIVNSLFPKGSKFVVPRDASINIFVKIIHFIAQEKLDFAMKEIIFDLIGANRSHKVIIPERMNIGLCAFLLIALSLQQKEGEPPMPQKSNSESNHPSIVCSQSMDNNQATKSSPYHSSQASGGRLSRLSINKFNTSTPEWNSQSIQSKPFPGKRKTSYSFMTLNDANAASLGIKDYINPVRKSFDTMLRLLDQQVIRTMLLTKQENINKEFDDVMTGQSIGVASGSLYRKSKRNSVIDAERKPKIELLKTCISAIPRLLPAEMSKSELVELLSRLSMHIDEELRMMSQQALINIIQELPEWRFKTIQTYLQFVRKEITDSSPLQLENNMKILYHLINAWKNTLIASTKENNQKSKALDKTLLDDVEGFCLVMLCQYRSSIRRLSVHVLKEVKSLIIHINMDLKLNTSSINVSQESPNSNETNKTSFVIDVIDYAALKILERCLPFLPNNEKAHLTMMQNIDFMTLAERTNPIWGVVSNTYSNNINDNHGSLNSESHLSTNLWSECIATIFNRTFLMKSCQNAVNNAWTTLMDRINHLFNIIDPSVQIAENRTSSLLRGGSSNKKPLTSNERDHCMLLWKNYITAACCVAPLYISQSQGTVGKYLKSPDQSGSTIDSSQIKNLSSNNSASVAASCSVMKPTSKDLLKILISLIKCEVSDLRNSVIEAMGHFNPSSLRDLMDELQIILRESVDKKQENVRRRKRKDSLRLYIVKILELLAYNGIFDYSEDQLSQLITVIDWLELLRPYLIQGDSGVNLSADISLSILNETRLHFCRLIQYLVLHAPKEKRQNLMTENFKQSFFLMIAHWTGNFVKPLLKKKIIKSIELTNCKVESADKKTDDLCYAAITAMCSLICCGPIFDPQALQEDGYILPWLLNIINSKDEKFMALCEETITLLLDYNSETHTFLDVMIDCCYMASNSTMKIVFLSIVRTFNNYPDYPCDYVSMITLALAFTSNIDTQIKENAYQLLQLLYYRFFIDSSFVWSENNSINVELNSDQNVSSPIANNGTSTKISMISRWEQLSTLSQDEISRALSEMLPDLTLSIFSEITQRVLTANPNLQLILLSCLVPWMYNIELIDFIYTSISNSNSSDSITQSRVSRTKQYSSSPIPFNKIGLTGNGWGSKQATDLVLNNLFYLTVRFGQELSKSLENIWGCLVNYRTDNMMVIIHYLIVITSLTPNSFLSYAKQIIVFLSKEKPKKLLENLFSILQTVDGINYSVERTQSLPFYRINNTTNNSNVTSQTKLNNKPNSNTSTQIMETNINLSTHDKGVMNGSQQLPVASVRSSTLDGFQISNKSQSEIIDIDEVSVTNYPQSAPGTLRFDGLDTTSIVIDEDKYATLRAKDLRKKEVFNKQPINITKTKDLSPSNIHPLPLPAYGGFSAPLNQFLNEDQCPLWTHGYKSSIVLMFFIDIVPIANTRSFWERDLELLLHCIILGLDHKESLVFQQCKILLIKILQILCPDITEFKIINLLMTGSTTMPTKSLLCLNGGACQSMVRMQTCDRGSNWNNIYFDEPVKTSETTNLNITNDVDTKLQRTLSSYSVTSTVTLIPSAKVSTSQSKPNSCIIENIETPNEHDVEIMRNIGRQSKNKSVRELIKIISTYRDRPMWGYEDVTISRYINDGISIINQISNSRASTDNNKFPNSREDDELILISSVAVLNTIIKLICSLIDADGTLVIKWAQLALNTGVNCTHRHYASRSLQIFRALGTTFDGTKLSALYSRLLDTIGDLNEDVQCYVVELFLTLESGIKNLNPQEMFANSLDDNCSDTDEDDLYRSTPNLKNSFSSPKIGYHKDISRQRGTTVGGGFRILNSSNHHQRASAVIESTTSTKQPSPRRPASLKGNLKDNKSTVSSNLSWDERTDLVCEIFWLANILMESELEHEFYAGLRFLSLLMNCLNSSHFDMRSKLEKIVQFCNWGSLFPGTIHLLIKGCFSQSFWPISAQLLSKMVVNVNCSLVDPTLKVGFPFTVLTLLVSIFDEETQNSRLAAKNIASIAKILSPDRLGNLILVMQLYSGGTFNKDHTQWTRCVVKYLYDAYSEISAELLAFINRMLLECPSFMHSAILQVLGNFIYYINMNESAIVYQLNKIIESLSQLFINNVQWKEVYPILRLLVSKNSSLSLPTSKVIESSVLLSLPMVPLPEAETPRLELPGRILEYQFDVKNYCMKNSETVDSKNNEHQDDLTLGNKKNKTKELLLQLINYFGTYGYRIGFPKSPSVIFSQSTETLEHQVSLHSSSETTSTNDISLADDLRLDETSSVEQAQVFRDLDEYLDSQLKMNFLDLPDNKWEDDRKPSWGVRSQSITHYNEFSESINQNQSTNKIQNSSTFAEGTENSPNFIPSPSKTLPCRSHKSPISKAIGGPCSSITSPQMSRCESTVTKPQSLSFINSTPNSQHSFSFKTYSGNLKTKYSPISFKYNSENLKKNKNHSNEKIKVKNNSLSSEEETDWKREKNWELKSKIKDLSSSSSDEVDDEDEDIDDDESLCRDEINSVMHKNGNQRRRLYTSSMERSSSNTYEKETESVWFETLTRALNNNTSCDETSFNSSMNLSVSGLRIIPSSEWLSNLWIKFPLVFEDCCSKCRVCITEANYYLSTVNDLSSIGSEFVEIITRVCRNLTTPLFHLGKNHYISADLLLESQKLTLMQLQETYDKFCNHMEYSTEILDLLKRSTRINHLEPIKPDEKRINLCRHLDKMMKQLFLMYESHCRLLSDLKNSIETSNNSITDLSDFVKNVANKLSPRILFSVNNKSSPTEDLEPGYITNVFEMEKVEEELYNALVVEDIGKVINIWRLNRVGLVVFNKALESNNPAFYLMQMFCLLYAKDSPDLLVYVSSQDIGNSTNRSQQVSSLAAALVPISSKISSLEKDLQIDCPKKTTLISPIDTEQSVVHITSDSSVM